MKKKFDVFLSYSSKDNDVVRDIAMKLKEDKINVWFDEWEIKPGDSVRSITKNAIINDCQTMICFVSNNAYQSDWVEFETNAILFNDPINKNRKLIPIKLDNSSGAFDQFNYIDWRDPSKRKKEYIRLFNAIADKSDRTFRQAYVRRIESNVILMNVDISNITFVWNNEFNQKQFNKFNKEKLELQLNIQVDDLEYITGERFNLNHIFDQKNSILKRDENGECEIQHIVHEFETPVLIPTLIPELVLQAVGVEWDVKITMPSKEQWKKVTLGTKSTFDV